MTEKERGGRMDDLIVFLLGVVTGAAIVMMITVLRNEKEGRWKRKINQ